MRVLFLNDAVFEDLPGGSRVVARELARGLIRRGHDVTFLVPGAGRTLLVMNGATACGSCVIQVGAGMNLSGQGRRPAPGCGRRGRLTWFTRTSPTPRWGRCGRCRRTFPVSARSTAPGNKEGWVEDDGAARAGPGPPTRRWQSDGCAGAWKPSTCIAVMPWSSSASSRAAKCCVRVPGGAHHLSAWRRGLGAVYAGGEHTAVRRSSGCPKTAGCCFLCGGWPPRMGLDRLVAAMPAVVARCPDALLLIGGQGPERERLGQHDRVDLRMENHVRLVGFIPDDALASYYQAADLFVLPTVALEGFGLVTVEALACGTPVVGTPVGATPEILRRLDDATDCPGRDRGALAESILAFLAGELVGGVDGGPPATVRRGVLHLGAPHRGRGSRLYAVVRAEAPAGNLLTRKVFHCRRVISRYADLTEEANDGYFTVPNTEDGAVSRPYGEDGRRGSGPAEPGGGSG